jgi:outer membrane receptor protein involved in Fe transport
MAGVSGLQAHHDFKIPAQPLDSALLAFSDQANVQVLMWAGSRPEARSPGAMGKLTARVALQAILDSTGLVFTEIDPDTVAIAAAGETMVPTAARVPVFAADSQGGPLRLAQAAGVRDAREQTQAGTQTRPVTPDLEELRATIPEILVVGGKSSLNMDIQRTRDDAQPYIVFDREALEKSGARNLEEFLKNRLNANAAALSMSQFAQGFSGNQSQVNLRGLGANQTLILVDGHRRASAVAGVDSAAPGQPDINGIPFGAIERIEVLPATASGIYGGGATGGVVNIVMRRDYHGTEMRVAYGGSFDGGAASRRVDISNGFTLEDGKSSVTLIGSYADTNPLLIGDRDLSERGRAHVFANAPQFYLGASNPPLGATTNVRSVNGANLVLDNGTRLNSAITYIPYGYAGANQDGTAALVANAGMYNLDVANTPQVVPGGGRVALLSGSTLKALATTLRRDFGEKVKGFLDLGYSDNLASAPRSAFTGVYTIAANAPNNPFNQQIRVTTPIFTDRDYDIDLREYRGVGGFIVSLPASWQLEADYNWDRVRQLARGDLSAAPATAPDALAVSNGTIDVLRDTNVYPADFMGLLNGNFAAVPRITQLREESLRLAGPLRTLPGGALTLSASLAHRREGVDDASFTVPTGTRTIPGRWYSADSAYVELRAPLVSASNKMRGVEELEMQFAVRRDEYETHGSTSLIVSTAPAPVQRATNELSSTDPTVAFRYRPVRDVMFRLSYGTGFLPPGVDQLVPTAPVPISTQVRDPRRGNEAITGVTAVAGGNADLRAEQSKSWSVGLVLTPRAVAGLRWSLDWSRIDKSDNIVAFGPLTQALLDREGDFPARFIRATPPPGDPFGVGKITQFDLTAVNLARARIEAWDTELDYTLETDGYGKFDWFANGTYMAHYETKTFPSDPFVDSVGISSAVIGAANGAPLRLRASGGLSWSRGPLTLSWSSQYFHHYIASTTATIVQAQGNGGRVPSQVYHDVAAAYAFGPGVSWLENTELRLGIQNVLNERPPVDVNFQNTLYRPFGDPRLANYSLSIRHSF